MPRLFSLDDGLVNGVPALSVQTPVVGGVLVASHSDFSSLDFFVCIDAHSCNILLFAISFCTFCARYLVRFH